MDDHGFINHTPFAAQELYLADEDGRSLLTVIVQAAYDVAAGGAPTLAEEQPAIEMAGTYHGEPGRSSYRYEPQVAPLKLATDVVLLGHAYAGRGRAPHVDVGLQVGPVSKVVRVFGDRHWYRRMGFESISEPQPFERLPLIYERAFGGWDRTPEDPEQHSVEPRNPVGTGYHHKKQSRFVEGAPLPNIEDPGQLIASYTDAPPPAGFGFLGPEWAPRARYAGTYDAAWAQQRMPLLPRDFDRRFYNAASVGLVAPGFLRGNEPVVIANVTPAGRLAFRLPGEPPPACTVHMKDRTTHAPEARLDTILIDTDDGRVLLVWRAHLLIPGGRLHEIRAITVAPHPASAHAPKAASLVPAS